MNDDKSLADAKAFLLSYVTSTPVTPDKLIEIGKQHGISPDALRWSWWNLVARGKLDFTADYCIFQPDHQQDQKTMATNDVPGANSANNDVLAAGSWAEHADGSLIYVKGTEADRIVYEIYDLAVDPIATYTDAMPKKAFEKQFSHPPVGTSTDSWTWHDKTPFPWDRVMKNVKRPTPGFVSAEDHLSAAARVAESLKLRAKQVEEEDIAAKTDIRTRRGRAILDKIARAVEVLLED